MSAENWSVTEPQTLQLEGVTSLRAGIVGGRLDVIVHEDAEARVEVSEIEGDPLIVSLEEGRLEIRHQLQGAQGWFKNLLGTVAGTSQNSTVVSISVPPGTAVEVGTVTGDGLVSGSSPSTRLNTVSGSLMSNATTGELHVNTVSGEVIVRAHTGIMTAKTVSGEVTASGDLTHVRANAVSGGLVFDTTGFCSDLGANTVSGDVTIRLPKDIGVDLSATTTSGHVTVDSARFAGHGGKHTAVLGPDRKLMLLRTNTVSGSVSVVHDETATSDDGADADARD